VSGLAFGGRRKAPAVSRGLKYAIPQRRERILDIFNRRNGDRVLVEEGTDIYETLWRGGGGKKRCLTWSSPKEPD